MNTHLICRCLFFTLLFSSPALGWAQEDEERGEESPLETLITDRPDFTESSSTVPTGRIQLEAGVQYTRTEFGPIEADTFDGPQALVRYGINDFSELRLGVPNISFTSIDDQSETTFGALSAGAKLATSLAPSVRVGVIPFVEVGVETGDVSGGAIATAAFDLSDSVALGVNAGLTSLEGAGDERILEGSGSVALGVGLTDELSLFVEGYTLVPDGEFAWFADAGFTYLLTPHLQVDAFGGVELEGVDSIFGGAGVSVLF